MPSTQKVRNWKDYNAALKRRGALIFSFDRNYLSSLYYSGERKRGGIVEYSKAMYEYLLTIKVTFRLPWRAATGFAQGLLQKAFPNEKVYVPDYAHASRASAKLDLKIKQVVRNNLGGMELGFDSTGVNVYTTSGWHQRKYGSDSLCRKREQWKKIHIAMDLDSMQIVAMAYTDSNTNDCEVVKELSDNIALPVKSVRADGAYDTEEFYKIIDAWGAKAIIPPAKVCKAQDELKRPPKIPKAHLKQRDDTIKAIRSCDNFEEGLKQWKVASGYHRRSLVESCMFRLKRSFGFYLHHRTDAGRKNEIIMKVNVLNAMASLGRAQYRT